MCHFNKFLPVVALLASLAPLASSAHLSATQAGTSHVAAPVHQLAANSKGRPGEYDQVAANSKGRTTEFSHIG